MRTVLTFAAIAYAGTLHAQYPMYGHPTVNPYMTKWEAMQQNAFENQQRLRQQAFLERTTPERNEALDFAEQALRVRALKAQERYYRTMDRQQQQQPAFANPFLNNPFLK